MTRSRCASRLHVRAHRALKGAKKTISKAIKAGLKIAVGTDAPAIPHGDNARELVALVERGMTPLEAIRAATTMAAELINSDDLGAISEGFLADIIAVAGNPLEDIETLLSVDFVMKGGRVFKSPDL